MDVQPNWRSVKHHFSKQGCKSRRFNNNRQNQQKRISETTGQTTAAGLVTWKTTPLKPLPQSKNSNMPGLPCYPYTPENQKGTPKKPETGLSLQAFGVACLPVIRPVSG
jgi:hypothetical protein